MKSVSGSLLTRTDDSISIYVAKMRCIFAEGTYVPVKIQGIFNTLIILLFARSVNRADDVSVAIVDTEKLRTSYEVRRKRHS